jgi:serine/threonine protein kinase
LIPFASIVSNGLSLQSMASVNTANSLSCSRVVIKLSVPWEKAVLAPPTSVKILNYLIHPMSLLKFSDKDMFNFQSLARQLFQLEAGALSRAGQHPQVPRLIDWFTVSGRQYLIQEYIPGTTLSEEFCLKGPFSEDKVRLVLQQVLGILIFLEDLEIVHRDIKPQNLMRHSLNQQIVLIDFGLAQLARRSGNSLGMENILYQGGTLGYGAPEQLVKGSTYASDLYSLAATCVYLMRGIKPRDLPVHPNTGRLLWDDPNLKLSEPLRQALNLMLSPVPAERLSASELQTMLFTAPVTNDLFYGFPKREEPSSPNYPVNPSSEKFIAFALKKSLQGVGPQDDSGLNLLQFELSKIGGTILSDFYREAVRVNKPKWENLPGISSELNTILRGLVLGEFSSMTEVQTEIQHYFRFHPIGKR